MTTFRHLIPAPGPSSHAVSDTRYTIRGMDSVIPSNATLGAVKKSKRYSALTIYQLDLQQF